MRLHLLLAGGALCASLTVSTTSQASITGSLATWEAAVGTYNSTSSTGLGLYSSPVPAFSLSDGMVLTLANGQDDTVLQPLNGWGPWSGNYAGDIIDTCDGTGFVCSKTETISFLSRVSALGMDLSPDVPLFGPYDETFTVTLSNGETMQFGGSYPNGTTQFIGFYNSPGVTSMTITVANASDFAFGNFVDVPEPASIALLAAGIGALRIARRRSAG